MNVSAEAQSHAAALTSAWEGREANRVACRDTAQQAYQWAQAHPERNAEYLNAAQVLDAFVHWREGRLAEALQLLEGVLCRTADQVSLWRCRAVNVQVGVDFELGHYAHSLTLAEEQIQLARQLGDLVLEASALHDMGVMHNERGSAQGETFLVQAKQLFSRIQAHDGLAYTHLNLAQTYLLKGEQQQALTELSEAERLARQHDLQYALTYVLAFRGKAEMSRDEAQAERLFSEALSRQHQYGDRPMWEAVEPLAQLYVRQRRHQEAQNLLEAFLREAQGAGLMVMVMQAHALLADVHERMGQHQLALHHLKQHLHDFKQQHAREHEQKVTALEVMHRTEMLRHQAATDSERAEQLLRLSLTDELTQLGNRRLLMQQGAELLRQQGGAVAVLDIDHFKHINDRLGHDIGDVVLFEFASALQEALPGQMVVRFGGEEFVVLFPNCDSTEAHNMLNAFRIVQRQATKSRRSDQQPYPKITFTAGITNCPDGDLIAALRRADKAVYQGKNDGRDRVLVYEVYAEQRTFTVYS